MEAAQRHETRRRGLGCDMKGRITAKLKSISGESLGETLISLVIAALALLMLAGAISAATNVIMRSKEAMNDYYSADVNVATHGSANGTVEIGLSNTGFSGNAVISGTGISENLEIRSISVSYYLNNEHNTSVISYESASGT